MMQRVDSADRKENARDVPVVFAMNSGKTAVRTSVEKELLISLLRETILRENPT